MNPFEQIMAPSMLGQRAAMNALNPLRNMLLLQREQRYDSPPRLRTGRQNSGYMNPQMSGPDYSAFTYDPSARVAADRMLSPYGLHPLAPEQVNPNALMPNVGWFGNHPLITRGIEGGLFGAAATHGADTWGEGISNVAQGLIDARQTRQAMIHRQFAQPFEQAERMEGLQRLGIEDQLHEAMIQWHRAQTDALHDKPALTYDRMNATRPVPLEGGRAYMTYDVGADRWKVQPNPFYIEPQGKPDSPEQQYLNALGDHLSAEQILHAHENWGKRENGSNDKGPWMTVPDGKGGTKLIRAYAGMNVPAGAQTLGQFGSVQDDTFDPKQLAKSLSALDSTSHRNKVFEAMAMERLQQAGDEPFDFRKMVPTDEEVTQEIERQKEWIREQYKSKRTPFPQSTQQPSTDNAAPTKTERKVSASPIPGHQLTDISIAREYLQRAGGDKDKARQLARQDAWDFGDNSTTRFSDNGRTYNIPSNLVEEFKRDHPNAQSTR